MSVRELAAQDTLVKTLQPALAKTHRQTAVVRMLVDELERFELKLELGKRLNDQLADELKVLAHRVFDLAEALDLQTASSEASEPAPSGVRLRNTI